MIFRKTRNRPSELKDNLEKFGTFGFENDQMYRSLACNLKN